MQWNIQKINNFLTAQLTKMPKINVSNNRLQNAMNSEQKALSHIHLFQKFHCMIVITQFIIHLSSLKAVTFLILQLMTNYSRSYWKITRHFCVKKMIILQDIFVIKLWNNWEKKSTDKLHTMSIVTCTMLFKYSKETLHKLTIKLAWQYRRNKRIIKN